MFSFSTGLTTLGAGALAVLCMAALPSSASATPVVWGSSYDAALFSSEDGVVFPTLTFDGVAENFVYHGLQITATERQVSLGGNNYRITIEFTAAGDIFPRVPPTGSAGVNLGWVSNPLDLTGAFSLAEAWVTLMNVSGAIVAWDEYSSLILDPSPWDGFLTAEGSIPVFSGFSVEGVRKIKIEITGRSLPAVPEPGSALMLVLGMCGLGATRRRRSGAMLGVSG